MKWDPETFSFLFCTRTAYIHSFSARPITSQPVKCNAYVVAGLTLGIAAAVTSLTRWWWAALAPLHQLQLVGACWCSIHDTLLGRRPEFRAQYLLARVCRDGFKGAGLFYFSEVTTVTSFCVHHTQTHVWWEIKCQSLRHTNVLHETSESLIWIATLSEQLNPLPKKSPIKLLQLIPDAWKIVEDEPEDNMYT